MDIELQYLSSNHLRIYQRWNSSVFFWKVNYFKDPEGHFKDTTKPREINLELIVSIIRDLLKTEVSAAGSDLWGQWAKIK